MEIAFIASVTVFSVVFAVGYANRRKLVKEVVESFPVDSEEMKKLKNNVINAHKAGHSVYLITNREESDAFKQYRQLHSVHYKKLEDVLQLRIDCELESQRVF